ncbi:flagellar biosynthesis protein FlhB [Erythrobacter aureus]|uniref:Flagellar biosynthetic protein FlhB n=1 Tax=Erythrobacter aureus TaxID=2182384 RepID=A0A345YIE3_9SPHN|nr:flagellar biosynthesis protein FlhB [Erythrobacter aureus]AXK43695.1 flagellar biosynthesis protein FlhB [Erythrobacter aureus]
MSDQTDTEKTHEPTPKKLEDSRKKGEVANSPEMKHATMFVAAVVITGGAGVWTVDRLIKMFVELWGDASAVPFRTGGDAHVFASTIISQFAIAMLPLFMILMFFALATLFLQGRPTVALARLKLKWSKLTPLAGIKRIYGKQGIVEFFKTLAKFGLVTCVALIVVWPYARGIETLVGVPVAVIASSIADLVFMMLKAATILVVALAIFDFIYQRHAFLKKMRMSLQEIRDEHKNAEGDPKIKAKVRAIGMERAKRRMMSQVPEATVIVTNPTHYSIALKYDHGVMAAPILVAKGVDEVAFKIREVATAAGIPIVESPPLARALYASAELDKPIPTEHYSAVAEIIGYVMRLAREKS